MGLQGFVSPVPYLETERVKAAAIGVAPPVEMSWIHRKTYRCLRVVMTIVGFALPIGFLAAGYFIKEGMQGSISAFYHTEARDAFVGVLFVIGACLYVYKGYNPREDLGLTLAGIFLFGVAWFPTSVPADILAASPELEVPPYCPVVHDFCAIAFFALIAFVCVGAPRNGLRDPKDYRPIYCVIATLMLLVLAGAGVHYWLKTTGQDWKFGIFAVEASAVWVFAFYWWMKGRELRGLEFREG